MRVTYHKTQYEALGFLLACYPGAINYTFSMDTVGITEHTAAIDKYGPPGPGQRADNNVSRIMRAAIEEDLEMGMVCVTGAIDKDLGVIVVLFNSEQVIDLIASITY